MGGFCLDKRKKFWLLFSSMLTISAFTFGGGFVIVTLMKRRFVDELKWVDEAEMLDMTALAQSAPGPIAVNAAILLGQRVAGWQGMAAGVLGTIIPPLVILGVISRIYEAFAANRIVALMLKGMQAGVAAVIFDVAIKLGTGVIKKKNWLHIVIMTAAFGIALFTKVNVIIVILCAAAIGVTAALLERKRGGNA